LDKTEDIWLPVIGRALAYLCTQTGDFEKKKMVDRAKLLDALGIPRKDVADMLGTTPASITEQLRQARGKRRATKKKTR
jgi:hypothetical protein